MDTKSADDNQEAGDPGCIKSDNTVTRKRPAEAAETPPAKRVQKDLVKHVVQTTGSQKDSLDDDVAEFAFANNLPFSVIESPSFIKLRRNARPGYKPPSQKSVSGYLLDRTHERTSKHEGPAERKICRHSTRWVV